MKYYAEPKHNQQIIQEGTRKLLLQLCGSDSLMGLAVTHGSMMAMCYIKSIQDLESVKNLEASQMLFAAFKLNAICEDITAGLKKNEEYLQEADSYTLRKMVDALWRVQEQTNTGYQITIPSNPREMYFERLVDMMMITYFTAFKEQIQNLPEDIPSMPAYKDARSVVYEEFGL